MGFLDRFGERVGGIFEDFLEEVMIPDAIHRRLQKAALAYERGDLDAALLTLDEIERLHPSLARAHHLKGIILFHRGDSRLALDALRLAIDSRESAPSHLWAGLALEDLGQWRASQDHLQRASDLSPSPSSSLTFDLAFALGRVHLAQGRIDKAIKELRRAMRLEGAKEEVAIFLAEALLERGDHDAALAALSHIEREDIDDAHAHLVSARVQLAHHDHDAALVSFAVAAGSAGKPAQILAAQIGAARLALSLGRDDEAASFLDAAARHARGPDRADVLVLQGRLAERAGALGQAARAYELALQEDPKHGGALRGSGRLMLEGEAWRAALDLFERALDAPRHKDPESSLLGQGLARKGMRDFAGARQVLEEASKVRTATTASPLSENRGCARGGRAPHGRLR